MLLLKATQAQKPLLRPPFICVPVAILDIYLPSGDKRAPVVSPSLAVSSRQHKVPSYQETSTTLQVVLGSDNIQVGHVGVGVRLALCALDDLPWNRQPQGISSLSRELTSWVKVERGFS